MRASLLLILLCWVPIASAQPEVVSLEFGWEPGWVAQMWSTELRVKDDGAQVDSLRMDMSMRLRTEPHPDGLRVSFDSFQVEGIESNQELGPMQELQQLLGSLQPSYVIDEDGNFLSVEGIDALEAELRKTLMPYFEELPAEALEMMDSIFEAALSAEQLMASAQEEWNTVIGFWVGSELELGEVYLLEAEQPLPLPGNPVVDYELVFGITERVKCQEEDEGFDCLELTLESRPQAEAVAEVAKNLFGQLATGAEMGDLSYDSLDIVQRVTLVVYADTLLPIYDSREKNVVVVVTAEGETQSMTQQDLRTTWYEWSSAD